MKKLLLVVVACLFATSALGAGFQASLVPDVAIHPKTTHIKGFTLNLWGENPQTAFALGFVNGSTGQSSGFSWGLIANYAQSYKGVQLATVNYAENFRGLQLGFVNIAKASDTGVQIGLVNIMSQTKNWFTGFPDELAPGMIFVNWRF